MPCCTPLAADIFLIHSVHIKQSKTAWLTARVTIREERVPDALLQGHLKQEGVKLIKNDSVMFTYLHFNYEIVHTVMTLAVISKLDPLAEMTGSR